LRPKSSVRINRAKLCDILATFDSFLSDSHGFSAMTLYSLGIFSLWLLFLVLRFNLTTEPDFLNKLTKLEIEERFGAVFDFYLVLQAL